MPACKHGDQDLVDDLRLSNQAAVYMFAQRIQRR
jgi:hypothetical protein